MLGARRWGCPCPQDLPGWTLPLLKGPLSSHCLYLLPPEPEEPQVGVGVGRQLWRWWILRDCPGACLLGPLVGYWRLEVTNGPNLANETILLGLSSFPLEIKNSS